MENIIDFTNIYVLFNDINYMVNDRSILKEVSSDSLKCIETLKNQYLEIKDKFVEFKNLIEKSSKFLPDSLFNKLSFRNDILLKDIDSFINISTPEVLDDEEIEADYFNKFESIEKGFGDLDVITIVGLYDYQDYILKQIQDKKISIEDVQELLNLPNLSSILKSAIENVINTAKMEEELQQTKSEQTFEENIGAEQTEVEDEKGNLSNEADVVQTEQEKGQSLQDRINNIKYSKDIFYASAVNAVLINYEIERINIQIDSIEKKAEQNQKLSFREQITLNSLYNKREELKNYLLNTELTFMQARREKSMEKTNASIDLYKEKIEQIKNKQINYKSKIFKNISKYISNKKIGKLNSKIEKLNSKMCKIQSKQRQSMSLAFDFKSKMVTTKSNVVSATTAIKNKSLSVGKKVVETAKTVKEETSKIVSDISMYIHRKDKIEEIVNEQKPVTLISQPQILSLPYSDYMNEDDLSMGMSI